MKGLQRLFDEDLEAQQTNFVLVYTSLFNYLVDLKHLSIKSVFDEILIMFSRYYLHYIPEMKQLKVVASTNEVVRILSETIDRQEKNNELYKGIRTLENIGSVASLTLRLKYLTI